MQQKNYQSYLPHLLTRFFSLFQHILGSFAVFLDTTSFFALFYAKASHNHTMYAHTVFDDKLLSPIQQVILSVDTIKSKLINIKGSL